VRALDWGFDTVIETATGGRVRPRELFWAFYPPTRGLMEPPVWQREIAEGGAFLTHAEPHLLPTSAGAATTARFEQACQQTQGRFHLFVASETMHG
jgi:hypothetical protein